MGEPKLSSWEDFEREIGEVFRRYEKRRQEARPVRISPPLFRGQTRASWPLRTTLERYTGQAYTMKKYWRLIRNVKNHVESLTERRWDIGEYPEEGREPYGPPPGYEFMVYLRHHGFPSPLLDWTQSPHVAAFFAFRSAAGDRQEDSDSEVAIYCYHEYWQGAKSWGGDESHIIGLGPTITTTPRHFRQQSWYTICRVLQNRRYSYASHEEVFQKGDTDQDVLTKYRIPASQRDRFLERLSLMNITAYTLFNNEESLMETLAYSAIVGESF
jgi:hypothetical protein